eukprot:2762279-Amphidinium_carterae.1
MTKSEAYLESAGPERLNLHPELSTMSTRLKNFDLLVQDMSSVPHCSVKQVLESGLAIHSTNLT